MRQKRLASSFIPALTAAILAMGTVGCSEQDSPTTYKGKSGIGPGPIDPDAPKEFTTTASGLKYRILRKSDKKHPDPLDAVIIHYRGWLDGGKEFESTYHGGEAILKKVTELLAGWKEGVQLIGEGGMIELEIPGKLGFGKAGQPQLGIPENATLRVWIELIEVITYQTSPGPVDKDAPQEFTQTPSGLQYRIRRRATGPAPATDSEIELHFRAWLDDNTEISNTYRKGYPQRVLVKDFLRGFVEGLQYTGEGGMIELIVPPQLAFGTKKRPGIPANSTVHYLVELNKVR